MVKPQALFFSPDRRNAYLETALYERGTLDRHLRGLKPPRLAAHPKVMEVLVLREAMYRNLKVAKAPIHRCWTERQTLMWWPVSAKLVLASQR